MRVDDNLTEIKRAWQEFEDKVGLRGRKFYCDVRTPTARDRRSSSTGVTT